MEPSGSIERRGKLVVGTVMVAILILSLTLLQQCFDQSDYRNALQLLAQAPGPGWTIGKELVQRAGSGAPDCQSKLLSSFKGTVEVTCRAGPGDPYRFEVDLVRKAIRPTNPLAQALMEAVEQRRKAEAAGSAEADGGSAPDSGG